MKSCGFWAGGGRQRGPSPLGEAGDPAAPGFPGVGPPTGLGLRGPDVPPGPALTPAVSSAEHSSKLWSMAGTSGSSSDAIFPRPPPQR